MSWNHLIFAFQEYFILFFYFYKLEKKCFFSQHAKAKYCNFSKMLRKYLGGFLIEEKKKKLLNTAQLSCLYIHQTLNIKHTRVFSYKIIVISILIHNVVISVSGSHQPKRIWEVPSMYTSYCGKFFQHISSWRSLYSYAHCPH